MSWAALFPGQGSQSIGMGKFLYENFSEAKQCFEEASDALSINFKKLCFEGPDSELVKTENTQPCLLLVSTATERVVKNTTGISWSLGAGHSVGEYAACVAGGVLGFSSALRAVQMRGQAMQRAVPQGKGAMLAVLGVDDAWAEKICKWVEETSGFKPLEPANFNSPGQVVISGSSEACEWLRQNYQQAALGPDAPKAKLIPLAVSAPFHCSMMAPAEKEMSKVLSDLNFSDARFPIVQNVNAEPEQKAESLRNNLIKQISGSVRWTQSIKKIHSLGATMAVELGHGKVLAGLAKKIDSHPIKIFNVQSLDDLKLLENAAKELK